MTLDNDSICVIIERMNDVKRYTIDELTALTSFSRRTIRFYVEKGLVEPPAGRGMGGFYGKSQLDALRNIDEARKDGRSLASIARQADRLKPSAETSSREPVPDRTCAAPGRILRWELAPGLHLDAAESALENNRELLAALLEAAGLKKEEHHA